MKNTKKYNISLEDTEKFEKEFLEMDAKNEFVPASIDRKLQLIKSIDEAKTKNKSVNLRVNEHALDRFKRKAEKNGWNYQSVISAFIVQYADDRVHLE